jgi:hypothetical protein
LSFSVARTLGEGGSEGFSVIVLGLGLGKKSAGEDGLDGVCFSGVVLESGLGKKSAGEDGVRVIAYA